jgi:hypothetical protein
MKNITWALNVFTISTIQQLNILTFLKQGGSWANVEPFQRYEGANDSYCQEGGTSQVITAIVSYE